MKIHLVDDDTSLFGTPIEIARRMRGRAHARGRDLDAFMRKVAGEHGFELEGETLEERCEAFLVGLIAKGPARPVFEASVDLHAIRVLRRALGLSRERLAQALGVSLMTVNRWETGDHAISADRLQIIKRVLFEQLSSPAEARESTAEAAAASVSAQGGVLARSRQRVRQQMRALSALHPRGRGVHP